MKYSLREVRREECLSHLNLCQDHLVAYTHGLDHDCLKEFIFLVKVVVYGSKKCFLDENLHLLSELNNSSFFRVFLYSPRFKRNDLFAG